MINLCFNLVIESLLISSNAKSLSRSLLLRFNLVIESLLISRVVAKGLDPLLFLLFQSRNRESSNFK